MSKEIVQQLFHTQQIIRRLNIQRSDEHSEITREFGYIKFDENDIDSTTRLSQYIRLALETNSTTVVEFLRFGWRLPTPNLIISITGGGKRCFMSAHLRKIFQRGLVAAAATTNAWLITAGTNVGIVREVGKALNNYRYKNRKDGLDIPCIGICSWEYIAGREQLENEINDSSIANNNNFDATVYPKTNTISLSNESKDSDSFGQVYIHRYATKYVDSERYNLDANHTHFLLFDGETSNNDSLLLQRANIEKHSRYVNDETSMTNTLIPIVMILVEGGPFSIRSICHALQSNTPLVVVKGSGRAADLVSDLHTFYSQIENDHQFSSNETELNLIFDKYRSNNNWVDDIKTNLCQILSTRKQLVVIFEFESQRHRGNLEDAILEVLFHATKFSGDNFDELQLALAWHRYDYAEKHILTGKTISKWTTTDLCKALFESLRRGYVDFIELLLDYGISIEKLTYQNLEQLYTLLNENNGLPIDNENEDHQLTRNDYILQYVPAEINIDQLAFDKNLQLDKNAARELFLWSIFLDRFELSKYLCSKTWNQSAACLIGARIYRLAATNALHFETKQRYENNANEFDQISMTIINACFENDEDFAVDLLKQPAVAFYNVKSLKLAEEAKCRYFLASECVHKYVHQKWFGHINYKRKATHLKIFLCSIFFPLFPLFSIFLTYVCEQKQIISSNKSSTGIQTVIKSNRYITNNHLRWYEKMKYFYEAPIVRFWYHFIFFIIFLGLFSFVLLVDFLPLNIYYQNDRQRKLVLLPKTEIILHICVWCLIIEEIHHFIRTKSSQYFNDIWNLIDIISIIFYLVGFTTRFIPLEIYFTVSKIFLCLDLVMWFVGTLRLFAAFERLGPKLLMIFNTMKDLSFFLCFILIFLCGFSITSWSLLTSSSQIKWIYDSNGTLVNVTMNNTVINSLWTWKSVRDIAHYGVWKIFGQVDPILGHDSYSNTAFILAIVFVAIANVLLLNVLIALFNVTIQNVQEQSHNLWRYQRFLLVDEYKKKSLFPPPFNIIYYIFIIFRYIFVRIKLYRRKHRFVANESLLEEIKTSDQQQLKISDTMRRERAIANDYWQCTFKHKKNDEMSTCLRNLEQKIDRLTLAMNNNKSITTVNNQLRKRQNTESDV